MANQRILIVDDDRDIADTLAFIIRRSGFDVLVAYDGESAIKLFEENSFNCAFIDMMLPGIDGAEALQKIRETQPDLRAYMMTGYSAKDCNDKAVEAGALQILRKPVMPEDILGKLCEDDVGTVLVADDDPIFVEIITTTLQTAGWTVRTAENGLQAVDIVSRGGIGALVLDVAMPVLDGKEVCNELKRRGIDLPILIATSGPHREKEFESLGIESFMQKPVDPRCILEFVEQQIRLPASRAA